MTMTVYTTGYSGKKLDDLLDIISEINGIIFDIRFSPRSRNPAFTKKSMTDFFGDRYVHVNALGNQNFKSGPIKIVNYDAGREMIEQSQHDVILLCVCKDADVCHRTTVAELLRNDGFTVVEWDDRDASIPAFGQETIKPRTGQLSLFGDT